MINKMFKNTAIIEKIANILLNILIGIFGIVLLISIYTGIQIKMLGHEYANFFGYTMFEVQTNSMAKTIRAGDWIIVKLTTDVKPGDIITYEYKGAYITHRIVAAYKGTFITKGDANNAKDEPVDQSKVIGRHARTLGSFGILRKTILNPAVLIALIVTLFLFNSSLKKEGEQTELFRKLKSLVDLLLQKIKNKEEKIDNPIRKEFNTQVQNRYINLNLLDEGEDENPDLSLTNRIQLPKEHEEVKNEEPVIEQIDPPIVEQNEMPAQIEVEEKIVDQLEGEQLKEIEQDLPELKAEAPVEEIPIEEVSEEIKQDELSETSLFRVIPVDMSEIDETRLEIAKNEMEENAQIPKEEEIKKEDKEEEEVPESEEGLTEVEVDIKGIKSKNIINAMINVKKDEINEIIDIFIGEEKIQTNDATIKNSLITTYINAKYYNYYNDKDIEGRSQITKIEKIIKITASDLINYYNGGDTKYTYKVYKYANLLKIIANIDQAKSSVSESKDKKKVYKNEIVTYYEDWNDNKLNEVIEEIFKIQKVYMEKSKHFLKILETDIFFLQFNKIPAKKDLYAVDLEHNIEFNRVYSDYIIDKTYGEGIIAEDKISVLFTLLSTQIIKDMTFAFFNRKYIIHIPESLYKKEKKFMRLLKMLDDEYAKAHVMFLVTFKDLMQYKKLIKKAKVEGFRFVLLFNEEGELPVSERSNLYIANALFVDKNSKNYDDIIDYIPNDMQENIVYENISNKFKTMEGE